MQDDKMKSKKRMENVSASYAAEKEKAYKKAKDKAISVSASNFKTALKRAPKQAGTMGRADTPLANTPDIAMEADVKQTRQNGNY
jgi:hypothetical protein